MSARTEITAAKKRMIPEFTSTATGAGGCGHERWDGVCSIEGHAMIALAQSNVELAAAIKELTAALLKKE